MAAVYNEGFFAKMNGSPSITLVANAAGEEPDHRAQRVGRNRRFESRSGRGHAHLAGVGLREQSNAHATGRRQRHHERRKRLCLLHQPHAGKRAVAVRSGAGAGPGASHRRRVSPARHSRPRRSSYSPSFFVFTGGYVIGSNTNNGSYAGPHQLVSRLDDAGAAGRTGRPLCKRFRTDLASRDSWFGRATGDVADAAHGSNWRDQCRRAIRWFGNTRSLPNQPIRPDVDAER